MDTLRDLMNSGVLYRKKTCQRCGAEKMEKFIGYKGADWQEEPEFEKSGFGTIVIVPYDIPIIHRQEIKLWDNCASEFNSMLNTFKVNF